MNLYKVYHTKHKGIFHGEIIRIESISSSDVISEFLSASYHHQRVLTNLVLEQITKNGVFMDDEYYIIDMDFNFGLLSNNIFTRTKDFIRLSNINTLLNGEVEKDS